MKKSFSAANYLILVVVTFFSFVSPASARIVEDVEVRTRTTGYQIRFKFFLPLRYQIHSPRKKGDVLLIQLRPLSSLGFDDPDLLNQLTEREILSWDKSIPVPIKEMTYEGDSPDRPTLTLRFKEEVEFDVRSSADFRSLIVTLLIEKKAEEEIIQDPKKYEFKRIDARNGYQTASRKRYRPTHCMTRPNRRTTNLLDLTPTQKRRHPPRVAKKENRV